MNIVVLQNDLNKWLSVVGRIVPNRGQMPVLANVLLEAKSDGLKLAVTNLEVGMRVSVGGKVNEPGRITIPAKNLAEFVASLPAGNVSLETEGEKMKVRGGKLTAVFAGIAAEEFPVMPKSGKDSGKAKTVKLSRNVVAEIATEVAMAAANDESRPVLTGVQIKFEDKAIVATATDGFRLSRKRMTGKGIDGGEKGLIIPARTMIEMARVVGEGKKEEAILEIVSEANQVLVVYDGVELMSRILEGSFPDVDKIVPTDFKTEIVVDREELVRAVRAAGIFARDSSNVVRLKIQESGLNVSASAASAGEGEMDIEIEKTGDDGQIAFNYRYILDFLNSVSSERIRFKMNESLLPGVWGMEGDDDLVHLIMPVRV